MLIGYHAFFALVALFSILNERDAATTALVAFAAKFALDTLLVFLYVNTNSGSTGTGGLSYSISIPGIKNISTLSSTNWSSTASSRPFYRFPSRFTTDLIIRPTTDLIALPPLPVGPTCPLSGDLILAPAFDLILYGSNIASEVSLISLDLFVAPPSALILHGSDDMCCAFDVTSETPALSTDLAVASAFDLIVYGSDKLFTSSPSVARDGANAESTDPSGDASHATTGLPLVHQPSGRVTTDLIVRPTTDLALVSLTCPASYDSISDVAESATEDSTVSTDLDVCDSDSCIDYIIEDLDSDKAPEVIFNSMLPTGRIPSFIAWVDPSNRFCTPTATESATFILWGPLKFENVILSPSWRRILAFVALICVFSFNFACEWYGVV